MLVHSFSQCWYFVYGYLELLDPLETLGTLDPLGTLHSPIVFMCLVREFLSIFSENLSVSVG